MSDPVSSGRTTFFYWYISFAVVLFIEGPLVSLSSSPILISVVSRFTRSFVSVILLWFVMCTHVNLSLLLHFNWAFWSCYLLYHFHLFQDDDSYILPVLLRFDGQPEVDEEVGQGSVFCTFLIYEMLAAWTFLPCENWKLFSSKAIVSYLSQLNAFYSYGTPFCVSYFATASVGLWEVVPMRIAWVLRSAHSIFFPWVNYAFTWLVELNEFLYPK